jgi:hypothetical protein
MYCFDVLIQNENVEIEKISEKILIPIKLEDRADVFCNYGNDKTKVVFPNLCGMSFRGFKHKKPKNSFGFLSYEQNPVRGNGESIYLQSGVGHRNRGIFINENNLTDTCAVFSSKRLIEGNWINWYDEYCKPNNRNEKYDQYKHDSVIYSLFNTKSSQSSFTLNHNDNSIKIFNEFFWMSKDQMKDLADNNGYDNLYNDARTSNDRQVYKLLFGEERIYDKLSPDAKLVIDKATELVEKSMEIRQVIANDENHLDSWDAGYTQLKLIWKEYFQEDFKELRQLYKNLEDRMRPLVYELGFLIK